MRILADENISGELMKFLVEKGHDVQSIGREFPSIKDENIIAISNLENRMILTFDSDFGRLIFQKGLLPKSGVIYLRLREDFLPFAGEFVHRSILRDEIKPSRCLYVFNGKVLRKHQY